MKSVSKFDRVLSKTRCLVVNAMALAMGVGIAATFGCGAPSGPPGEQTGPWPSSAALSKMAPAAPRSSSEQHASADCVRDPHTALHKVRDLKPEESDLRAIRTHGGVLIFDIRIGASGKVEEIRLVKPVGPEPPWPTLAERWQKAISDWRYEPPTLNNKPVAVCLTVSINIEVQ